LQNIIVKEFNLKRCTNVIIFFEILLAILKKLAWKLNIWLRMTRIRVMSEVKGMIERYDLSEMMK
jgi:hypothetical protein